MLWSVLNTTADGSLYFNIVDLAKWDEALYTEKLLKKSSLDQMWTPVKLKDGSTYPYGFAWQIADAGGHRLIAEEKKVTVESWTDLQYTWGTA